MRFSKCSPWKIRSTNTPGIYVDRIVQGVGYQKWIEQRTVRKRESAKETA